MHELEMPQSRLLNGLVRRCAKALRVGAMVVGGVLLAAPLAHAGFENGGFETGDFSNWTLYSYTRADLPSSPPPTNSSTPIALNALGLSAKTLGSARSAVLSGSAVPVPWTNAGTLTYPRWGNHAARLNDRGGNAASSIEQTAQMTVADVDPIDGKIHVRFGMAPVLADGGHSGVQQPYFYVEVRNATKGTVLFQTFNYANQSGVPWQRSAPTGAGWGGSGVGDYRYTDWQGFDIAPGNGLLDVGDNVTLIVYAANCSPGAAYHEARVYLDAVGAFLPGLSVAATGPSTTKPGEQITYTYNYTNNSGVIALGSKVRVAAPMTENGLFTTFVSGSWPPSCTGPNSGVAPRAEYLECEVGASGVLNDGQSGSFNVTYTVPAGAATTAPNNVVNNGDYDIRSNTASPFIGPMVKTTILGAGATVVNLGVTVSNGGAVSYPPNTPLATPITVTVINLGGTDSLNSVVNQTLTGLTGVNWTCAPAPGSNATCGTFLNGSGPISGNPNLPAGQGVIYTITGTTGAAGTPVSTAVTVAPPAGTSDSQLSNNTSGLSAPLGTQHNVTANAIGSGAGNILAVPSALACGDASTACSTTGTTKPVAEGDEVRLTPVAHTDSIFKGWTGCTSTSGNVCVVTVGTTDVTATANFARAYIVTPAVDAAGGGTIGPNTPQQVEGGGSKVFTLTPDVGTYPVINPPATGATCSGSLSGNTYTVNPVTADCGFTVKFIVAADAVTVTTSVPGGNGTVTTPGQNAAGETVLGRGDARVWTVTPATGYVPRLLPGSTCTGMLSTTAPYTYTVSNATDCTANFAFAAAGAGNVASIPTLSEWGLIILSGLMALFAFGMRRRQML